LLYTVSKAFWQLAQPAHLLPLLFLSGSVLLFTSWKRWGAYLVALFALAVAILATVPIGPWILAPLEGRFPPLTRMPDRVDGIIMLGGGESGDEAEELRSFAQLARRWPRARLVFAGGGRLDRYGMFREADAAREALVALGVTRDRIILERHSRNTLENVTNARALANPQPNEIWILLAPAFHMPRTVGLFRGQGWQVVPDPVGSKAADSRRLSSIGLDENLDLTTIALKEWIGMLANRWLGHSASCFPSP
jgi:uncharacterized SAM-binding protein YcdF (DUF218 family)